MSGAFNRDRLPSWPEYADMQGLTLVGRRKWRNVLCDFHQDSAPSLRVNVQSGGWICMACLTKGGDVLAHYMLRTGSDFKRAAQDLGAWDIDKARHTERRPRSLSAADAMQVISLDLTITMVVLSDLRSGIIPTDVDWQSFLDAAGRIDTLAKEFRQ